MKKFTAIIIKKDINTHNENIVGIEDSNLFEVKNKNLDKIFEIEKILNE